MARARAAFISGVGLASAVGDAVTGSAAIRAGISRPRGLGALTIVGDDPEPVEVSGHPVAGCTDGAAFLGRWIRLAHRALGDLAGRDGFPPLHDFTSWKRTGLLAVVPEDDPARFSVVDRIDDGYIAERYVRRLIELLDWPLEPAQVRIVRKGRVGPIAGLLTALDDLTSGRYDRVIVLATDSLVETRSLQWLDAMGQLKTPARPVGVMPGEAAACLLLETPQAARARDVRPHARLESAVIGEAPQSEDDGGRRLGYAWAEVMEAALAQARVSRPFGGDLIADLSGLERHAHDFGMAQLQLNKKGWTAQTRVRLPAASIGDTGVASVAIALVVGTRSLVRREALQPAVLVAGRDDGGHVGAACLRRADDGLA